MAKKEIIKLKRKGREYHIEGPEQMAQKFREKDPLITQIILNSIKNSEKNGY